MIQRLRIFLAVAGRMSFTEAAFALGISQSAVSQQIRALESELGVKLIDRDRRRIELTAAGSFLAAEAAHLVKDADRLVESVRNFRKSGRQTIHIAYLNLFRGRELQQAVLRFRALHPETDFSVRALSHEEIYKELLAARLDLALSDQRRAFSPDFENMELAKTPVYVEFAAGHPLSGRKRLTAADIRAMRCILVAPEEYRAGEEAYFRELLGFKGGFVFTDTLDSARLMASAGSGFLLSQGSWNMPDAGDGSTVRVPLFKNGKLVLENFCAFCLREKAQGAVKNFARVLREEFGSGAAAKAAKP